MPPPPGPDDDAGAAPPVAGATSVAAPVLGWTFCKNDIPALLLSAEREDEYDMD